jgi:glycosyltransferase involved in cell wall biosynthesis
LAGFEQPDYPQRLRKAFAGAEAVLVVNPQIADIVRPHARQVCVVPSGFDPARFEGLPGAPRSERDGRLRILFAGLIEEYMKGFAVLRAAAERLGRERRDFELIVTAEAPVGDGAGDELIRFIGWQSQRELPQAIAEADLLVFPTVAQEALGRSAVEAMGCGRPVVASRIGGLEWVVEDGVTGLLFEPGNVDDLVDKLRRLLDDAPLRRRLGAAGRAKFEREFTWEVILARSYRPLFGGRWATM